MVEHFRKKLCLSKLNLILLISILSLLFFPFANTFLINPLFTNVIIKNAELDAIRLAKHLASLELVNNLKSMNYSSLDTDTLNRIKTNLDLYKIKLFDKSGLIVFSSDTKDIGKVNLKPYFHNIVAKGKIFSKVVKKTVRPQKINSYKSMSLKFMFQY